MAATIRIVPIAEQGDEELVREGWRKQTTLDEGRLHEVAEAYRALGYDVFVQEFRAEDGCTACFGGGRELGHVWGTVWIRAGGCARRDDELFD